MGYVRSGLRMDWHVYGVMRDTSPGAYTPTLGFATNMVSVTVIIFLGLLAFIFWLGSLDEAHAGEGGVRQGCRSRLSATVAPTAGDESPRRRCGRIGLMFSILLYTFAGLFLLWMILLSLGVRRIWLNVMLFSLEATLAYTIVGNLVPQIESRPQAAAATLSRCDAGAAGQSRRADLLR